MNSPYVIEYLTAKYIQRPDKTTIIQKVSYNYGLIEYYRFGYEGSITQKKFDELYEVIGELVI